MSLVVLTKPSVRIAPGFCPLRVRIGIASMAIDGEKSWDVREGRNARICLIRACVCGDDA